MLSFGFRSYETRRLYEAHKPVAQARIWKGQAKAADLGLVEDWRSRPLHETFADTVEAPIYSRWIDELWMLVLTSSGLIGAR